MGAVLSALQRERVQSDSERKGQERGLAGYSGSKEAQHRVRTGSEVAWPRLEKLEVTERQREGWRLGEEGLGWLSQELKS